MTSILDMVRTHLIELSRCKLCLRVTLGVFVAIIVIEAVILVVSAQGFEQDRVNEVEREALVIARTVVKTSDEQNPLAGVASQGPYLSRGTVLIGMVVLAEDGTIGSSFGSLPDINWPVSATDEKSILFRDDDIMLVQWPAELARSKTDVIARINVSEVPDQVLGFVFRIFGLVLIISIFVTLATMIVLERLVLRPLRGLDQGLRRAVANPDKPDLEPIVDMGTDEIRAVTTTFNRLSRRLSAAFDEIARQKTELESRNAELEEAVAARTRELQETVYSLRRRAAQEDDQNSVLDELDKLTGLPGRPRFWEQCRAQISMLGRRPSTGAILFINLDDFKRTNDTLGFDGGDRVLQTLAERITATIRESDSVARLGADEFAVLQTGIDRVDQPARLAERLISQLSAPVDLGNQTVSMDCSIGISLYPNDGQDATVVIGHANLAMRRAKEQSGSTYSFFLAEMEETARHARNMERNLRAALGTDQIFLNYQPKLDLQTGAIRSMEALLRWECPELGLQRPDKFIPIAERSRLIIELGAWVLREACLQTRSWNAMLADPMKVAVNVSPVQIQHGRIVDTVRQTLLETDLAPELLELEITESAIIENLDETRHTLQSLKDLGVSIAIDDFGTGYTSLQHLQHLPVDRIKIDRAFIKDIGEPGGDATIALAVIGIAQSLNLSVTAEGVETADQLTFLDEHGVDEIQGYHVSKPLDKSLFLNHVQQLRRLESA